MMGSLFQKEYKVNKLTDLQLFKEDGKYYFHVKYEFEDEEGVKELEIPKLRIPICNKGIVRISNDLIDRKTVRAQIGFGCENVMVPGTVDDIEGVAWVEKILKEKTHEMTVSEIEKKLGYKIKIVSEGKNGKR